jgi:hypothetical protein
MRQIEYLRTLSDLAGLLVLASCTSTYYRALESVGIEKRDILVDRIDDTRAAQSEAKEQFSSALEQYRSVVDFEGGDLEEVYDRLNAEYKQSDRRAQTVRDRIDSVEKVAEDLFEEWEAEIEAYSDPGLAGESRRLLADTRSDYGDAPSARGCNGTWRDSAPATARLLPPFPLPAPGSPGAACAGSCPRPIAGSTSPPA